MKKFAEIEVKDFAHAVVIIDIDGTITNDSGVSVDLENLEKIQLLKTISDVYLFSNGSVSRTAKLAEYIGVSYIDTIHKKPSRRVIEGLNHGDKKIVVIGDKWITDGLFAINIGAKFVRVSRIKKTNDSFLTRSTYFIDDMVGIFMSTIRSVLPFIALMRPTQWIKNLLVLAPVFFAATVLQSSVFMETLVAVGVFCVVSSAMYVLNDIRDVSSDRTHPTKRYRGIASGSVSVADAAVLFIVLISLGVFGLYILPSIVPVVLIYIGLNICYSLFLKHVAVIDVALVASFYVLRVLAGGEATSTYISPWIILCVFFGALFMAIGKRRGELLHASRRRVLDMYSQSALDCMLIVSATLALASYGLYSVLAGHSPNAVYSTVFVMIAIFRLLNQMFQSSADAEYPETLIFKDRVALLTTFAWALYMFAILYK